MAKKRKLRPSDLEAAYQVAQAATYALAALQTDERISSLLPELATAARIANECAQILAERAQGPLTGIASLPAGSIVEIDAEEHAALAALDAQL